MARNPSHGLLDYHLGLGRIAVLQVAIGRFQLQDQSRQPLGQRIVQFPGHPLPFLADGQLLNLGGVLLQLAVGDF